LPPRRSSWDTYILPVLGPRKLSTVQRRDIQSFADELRAQGLSPSTINNIVDPLRVIFRRAIRRDEIAIDPTNDLDMPAIRGRRDRIEPPEKAHELLAALPTSERAVWATALFCGLRRGELRGLQWLHVDFEAGVIRVERSWDPVKGPIDVKTGARHRAVPIAFMVRRELQAHKQRTHRDGEDLVFGRTATEAFFASTIRARANKAWEAAGLKPITPHEARHCAISYFAAGLDLGRSRRRPPDLEPLRPSRPRRRRGRPGPPRRVSRVPGRQARAGAGTAHDRRGPLPTAAAPNRNTRQDGRSDCGAHCGAPPWKHEIPREHGGFGVPLPGFEPGLPP
jgi:integrase